MSEKQIISKLPGIFYRKPSPDDPPFKQEGDCVNKGDVIGLVEVMKSFHEVKAETSGTIDKFHVENEAQIMPGDVIIDFV